MQYLTMQEAADLLKISYRKLWDMIDQGTNHPPYIMVGKERRFRREDIDRWAKDNLILSPGR